MLQDSGWRSALRSEAVGAVSVFFLPPLFAGGLRHRRECRRGALLDEA